MDQELFTIFGFKNYSSREGPWEQPLLLGNLYSIIAQNQGSTRLKAEIRWGDSRMETTQ